ncbi:MAG: putative sulfate exporter family transporter [Actinophytocola sp.]|uniref:YeiH family protein n=1 Tax=Actinophytocola sp. TaxID=1872138 RepID=UPI003C706214
MLPGLVLVAIATVVGRVAGSLVPAASALIVGILLGVAWRAFAGARPEFAPGLRFTQTWLLRTGVMLLGLQLAVAHVVHFGPKVLAVVLLSVAVTFAVTWRLGRHLGQARSLLLATGVSICGASAVAAVNTVADGDEEDVATAITAVTVLGTAAIGAVPLVAWLFGLSDQDFGVVAGASVHEVGQVVAIGGAAGGLVLQVAVVVKLTRVVLLAPLVIGLGVHRRRLVLAHGPSPDGTRARPPLVPWFVSGFVVLVVVRALGVLPASVIELSSVVTNLLLCAGMFALGAAVDLRAVVRTGGPSLAVAGAGSALLLALTTTAVLLV